MPIVLSNPSRVLVPLVSLAFIAAMYFPVFAATVADHGDAHVRYAIGTTAFLFCGLWLGYSGLKAPFRATIDGAGAVRVKRLLGERAYGPESVSAWSFARPEATPTQEPLVTNGMLMLKFADGTKFRAEITSEQSADLIGRLPKVAALTRL